MKSLLDRLIAHAKRADEVANEELALRAAIREKYPNVKFRGRSGSLYQASGMLKDASAVYPEAAADYDIYVAAENEILLQQDN